MPARDEGEQRPVRTPGDVGVVEIAGRDLDRLRLVGERIDHEDVQPAVGEEADAVPAVVQRRDPARPLLVGGHPLGRPVPPLLGHPGAVGEGARVRPPLRRPGTEPMVGDPPRLTAVGGHDVQLGLAVLDRPYESQRPAVGREARRRVAPPLGQLPRRPTAVDVNQPQLTDVLIVIEIRARDRDDGTGAVGRERRGAGDAEESKIGRLHARTLARHPELPSRRSRPARRPGPCPLIMNRVVTQHEPPGDRGAVMRGPPASHLAGPGVRASVPGAGRHRGSPAAPPTKVAPMPTQDPRRARSRTLFAGGQVFDGTGIDPMTADVVVEGGLIVDVGTGLDGDVRVDLDGATLLPGFFDCHVHVTISTLNRLTIAHTPFSYQFFLAEQNLGRTLDVGITSVRDAGGADLGIAQALADGLIRGPRTQIALSMLSQTGGHGDDMLPSGCSLPLLAPHPGRPPTIVDGPDEMRRKVRELIRSGADRAEGRDQRRRPVPARRPAARALPGRGDRRAGRGGHRGRPVRHGARAGRRRHQGRRPQRRPLHRARHLPRRRGHRDDARARHLAGPDTGRAARGDRRRRGRCPARA